MTIVIIGHILMLVTLLLLTFCLRDFLIKLDLRFTPLFIITIAVFITAFVFECVGAYKISIKCEECGYRSDYDAAYCLECGNAIQDFKTYCAECGKKYSVSDGYCIIDGTELQLIDIMKVGENK